MSARLLIAWLILAFANAAAAESADWEAGQQAFQDGDYQAALLAFAAARNSGLTGPAVHYNIAVCHFKLGHFHRAREEFRLIAERFPGMAGLAEYNLGLVALREGDQADATQHFLRAHELSPQDKTLRILASNRLRELEPERRRASDWSGAFGLRAGFDDNVALRAETGLSAGTTAESPMTDLYASIEGPWNTGIPVRVEGSLYVIRNFDADEFDQTEVMGGAIYEWRRADWRVQAGAHLAASSLGGDSFDRKAGASVRARHPMGENGSLHLAFVYDDVSDRDSLFAGIDGSRQQLRARYRWRSGGHRLSVRLANEWNDRDDPGVSPDRIGFAAEYRYQPDSGWGYEGGLMVRNSDYDDLAITRSEDLLSTHVALTRKLDSDWLLVLEYRYSDNDSSDPVYSYDRQQITAGVMRVF